MEIRIVAVGRMKGGFTYLQRGVDEYIKRMKPYAGVSIVEVPDEAVTASRTPEQIMEKEGERLLSHMDKAACSIALSERGELMNSLALAQTLSSLWAMTNPPNGGIGNRGSGPMIFVVGGALGLSQTVLDRADRILSLSPLTFPHLMVRLILVEQIYRTFKILKNEPYHK